MSTSTRLDETKKSLNFKRILKEKKLNVKNPLDTPKSTDLLEAQDQIKEEVDKPLRKIKYRRIIKRK
jgi:hypothetical protein